MKQEYLIEKLKQYNYKYNIDKDGLTIFLGLGLTMNIIFSDSKKMMISDRLIGWNLLTGVIKMTITQSIIYNSILFLFFVFLITGLIVKFGISLEWLIILYVLIILFWTMYYHVKAEGFKNNLIRWIDEAENSKIC